MLTTQTSYSGLPVPPDISFAGSLNDCLRIVNSFLIGCGSARLLVIGEGKCFAFGPDLLDDVIQDVRQESSAPANR